MTTKTLCKCGHEISQHSYNENFTGCDIEKCDCDLDMGLFVDKQSATIATLTAHNESMQADARENTVTVQVLMAQLAELKAPIEEIRELKQALTDIRATTVTLGDSQSAWLAWRKCSEIAGKALRDAERVK